MIQLNDISVSFGGREILSDVTWTIRQGKRIGLVGPNGAGKTTLLRVLSKEQSVDSGTMHYGGMSVGYLRQDTQESDAMMQRSVLEEALQAWPLVLELEREEKRLLADMDRMTDHESAAYMKVLESFNRVHEKLLAQEVHLIRPKTEAVLTGLGFDPDDLERPLNTFSGGWRMRVVLARMLLAESDVLLLDEPTNHLDIDSIAWLEEYLKTYPGTVVLVSHDRWFLDRMVTSTAELMQGRLTEYAGNYSFYLTDRQIRRDHQRAAWQNQQKLIADNEKFIERFRYKSSKATQVQSRVKMLEKLERVPEPPTEAATITFRFPEPRRSGRTPLEISRFSKTYPTENEPIEVFRDAGPILLERGQKIALIGKNGAGKSTFARILLGTESFDGERTVGYNVEMTYFAQHQAESLNRKSTALDALREVSPERSETELRSILGAFLFRGDDVFKPISVLSGGERSRVALARTLASPANLLILDEPTNHLDIQSIDVLIEALRQYSGTFVVVSHDRHFLDRVADHVWRVEDGSIRQFAGNYSEYRWQIEHGTASRVQTTSAPSGDGATRGTPEAQAGKNSPSAATGAGSGGPKSKEQKRVEAEQRRREKETRRRDGGHAATLNDYQLRKEVAEAEKEVEKKEARKKDLEAALADPEIFADEARGKKLMAEYDAIGKELEKLIARWESLAEEVSERTL